MTEFLRFSETELPGVFLIEPRVFRDERGLFLETFHEEKYYDGRVVGPFVQDDHSQSVAETLRGLHAQWLKP